MSYTTTLSTPKNALNRHSRPLVSIKTRTKQTTALDSNRVAKCDAFGSVYYKDLLKLQTKHSNVVGLSCCGRKTTEGCNVTIGLTDKGIKKDGIFYCKSFLCVRCSKRRVAEQSKSVAQVIEKLHTAYFITLTIKAKDDWGEQKEELLKCWNSLRGRVTRWCDREGIDVPAYFRTIDFTISPYERNPHLHTHLHIALGWTNSIGYKAEEFRIFLRDAWVDVCARRGNYSSIKGQDIQLIKKGKDNSKSVGFYLSKPVLAKLGAELTSLHKDGSGVGRKSFGLGRLMCEIVDAEGADKERLTKIYSKVCEFLKGSKFQVKNKVWRDLEEVEEVEEEEIKEPIKKIVIGNHNFHILVRRFGAELLVYAEDCLMRGGKELAHLTKLLHPDLLVELNYDFQGIELEETYVELFNEHLHQHSIDWRTVDRRKVTFIRH